MQDVTLVIPTLGRESLSIALRSAIEQTVPFTSIIVVPNKGTAASTRNVGCKQVTTTWTAFLDDDDILYPWHLETLLANIDNDVGVIYTRWDGNLSKLNTQPLDYDMLRKYNYIPVTSMVRTAAGNQVGWFPEPTNLHGFEDWGLWNKLLDIDVKFKRVDTVTWKYVKDA